MSPNSRPPGYEGSSEVSAADLESLPTISHQAVHILERCIAEHHVAAVDYTNADGRRTTITIRPAFIRYNSAHHIVVWGFPAHGDHWIELLLDSIGEVRDTGDVFEPTW